MEKDKKDLSQPKTPREYLRLLATGFAMGSADIVPGVSGGTMAFILGVYESLINGIKSLDATAIKLILRFKFGALQEHMPLRFLIALAAGIFLAIITLSGFLSSALGDPTGRILVFAFFFGLVWASIIAVGAQVKWTTSPMISLIGSAIVAFIIVNLVPAEAPHEPLNLFVSGMFAICAMILPGISGAFILLILGQYDYVLTAVSQRDVVPVLIVMAGAVIGLIGFSRILSYFLSNFYQSTVAALVGFMVGSLWKIWPWKECAQEAIDPRHPERVRCLQEANLLPDFATPEFVTAVVLAIIGLLLVSVMDHLQTGKNPLLRGIWKRS